MIGAASFVIAMAVVAGAAGLESDANSVSGGSIEIAINDTLCTADADCYPIRSGRANSLAVQVKFAAIGQDALTAVLVRICPDGRSDKTTAELTPERPRSVFDLGALAAPAQYDYECGVVFRRGYRFQLDITATATGVRIAEYRFYQGPARSADGETLWKGDVHRYVYNSGYDGGKGEWRPNDEGGRPMDPPFLLQLDPAVLSDPDLVTVQFRQKDGLGLAAVPAELAVMRIGDGRMVATRDVSIGANLTGERMDCSSYHDGDYRIELRPIIAGTQRREGPQVIYRRARRDPATVLVSPLAPWTLRRDSTRKDVIVSDFRSAVAQWATSSPDPHRWTVGRQLLGRGDVWAQPVRLRPRLTGHYAIFAHSSGTCYVSAGKDGIVRRVGPIMRPALVAGDQFVVATDLTGGEISIYQSGTKNQGIVSLRLTPVTAESLAAFEAETTNPPARLVGHCDWLDYFTPGVESRLAADQWEALVKGHGELGMRDLQWAVGRSALLYDTKLPNATRFPAVPIDTLRPEVVKQAPHLPAWSHVTNMYCPLAEVEKQRERHGVRIWPWLAMQRHYGLGYGGVFASKWFLAHPEWHRWPKHAAKPAGDAVSFFFADVRKERVDILCELAARKPDGIVVDCVRQPPMLLYHPKMVAAYRKKTGVDPQSIDASAGKTYEDWIRWRADFFTETLRELKARLTALRDRGATATPVAVRIPSSGMFYNLAQGLDVDTWCRERLLDRLEIEPLDDLGGRGSHDVRPYLALCRRYGIPVFGGINANTFRNPAAIMHRAKGLLDAHVDGLYFFESNQLCATDCQRWTVPLLGNRRRLSEFLTASNIEACYPIRATNACSGFDNHSFGGGGVDWNVYEGKGGSPL